MCVPGAKVPAKQALWLWTMAGKNETAIQAKTVLAFNLIFCHACKASAYVVLCSLIGIWFLWTSIIFHNNHLVAVTVPRLPFVFPHNTLAYHQFVSEWGDKTHTHTRHGVDSVDSILYLLRFLCFAEWNKCMMSLAGEQKTYLCWTWVEAIFYLDVGMRWRRGAERAGRWHLFAINWMMIRNCSMAPSQSSSTANTNKQPESISGCISKQQAKWNKKYRQKAR